MTSGSGIIFRGLMDDAGFQNVSFGYSSMIFIASVIFSFILIALFRYIPKSNRSIGVGVSFDKPEPFTDKQKTTLYLIISMIVLVLIFPVLHIIVPGSAAISSINSRIDVGLVAIIFAVIALMLKLAPQKEVIANVPWNTIIMICGVGMLIGVAIEAGTIELLSDYAGSNLPVWLIPIAFSVIAAVMSFFSSTLGVVCPALFPVVPALAASTGINPMILFACIVIGAQSSAISPFSSGGSLVLGSCSSEEERGKMFPQLLFLAVPCSVLVSTIYNFVLSMVF